MMKDKGAILLGIVAALVVIVYFSVQTTNVEQVSKATEIVQTAEEKQLGVVEGGEIVFRYEEDQFKLLEDENHVGEKLSAEELAPYVKPLETEELLFREEPVKVPVYHAGTIYVPKDISSNELTKITNQLSQASYAKYQKENPEADSEYVFFYGTPEAEFDRMNYSEYDYFEYKKLANVMVWSDETLSTQTYAEQFGVIVDIYFY